MPLAPPAAAGSAPAAVRDPGWRRLRFLLVIGLPGVLANALAVQLPGAVPFLLGNMAFVVLGIRLGWRYALLGALLVTAGFVEPRWTLLALAEALLVGLTRARGPLLLAWLKIWAPLLVPALWATRPVDGDPVEWMMGVGVLLTNGLVGVLGARLIVQLSESPRQRRLQPFRVQLAAQLAVATAAPIAFLMMIGLQLRFLDDHAEASLLLGHRARQLAAEVDSHLDTHLRVVGLAARQLGDARAPPLAELRAAFPALIELRAVGADGTLLALAPERADAATLEAVDERFGPARALPGPWVGPAFRHGSDALAVPIAVPIGTGNGAPAGAVQGTLALDALDANLRAARGILPIEYQVFDRAGQRVADSLGALAPLARPEPGSPLALGIEVAGSQRPPREVAHQRARAASAAFGWEVHAMRPLGPVRADLTAMALLAALLCLGLILLLRWLAERLAVGIARPVARLVERVQGVDLRDPGTLHPLQLEGDSAELHELIGSVDAMLDRLGELHAELTRSIHAQGRLNRELEARVERRTAELKTALERSERLAQAKTVFLANMSHELRTPLAAILGYTEQALRRGTPASVWLDTLRTIERNGRHLLGIVNDVLDASRIESGQLEVEAVPVSPLALAEEAVALMMPPAREKQLALELQLHWPLPERVAADRLRLKQVLLNLLGNALKFTEHGRIVLRVAADPGSGQWWFEVEDSGIGISVDQQRRLFERFQQADVSTTRRFGGAGLGLFISHQLARRMGGRIELDSEPGRGSRFRLCMPLPAEPHWIDQRGSSDGAAATEPREVPRLGGRVLLAEDVPDLRRLVSTLLRDVGAEVVAVENGREAFERASTERFDLLLLDMHMPVMDGREATEALRAAGYRSPIVALTADVIADDVERYRQAGCDHVLAKPVDRNALIELLCRYLPAAAPAAAGNGGDRVNRVLEQLAARYRDQLPTEIEALVGLRDRDPAALAERLHRIKGSAGSFGFPRITERAAAAEAARTGGDAAAADAALDALLDEMRSACR